MTPQIKLVNIPRNSIWGRKGTQERLLNKEIEKMRRKGYRYVDAKPDWSGLKVTFEREE